MVATPLDTSSTALALKQYSGDAVSLFNNMKTPASILAGAMIPLALLNPVPIKNPDGKSESRFEKILRMSYRCIGVMTLLSELISVMYATVAVNQLIETTIEPAESVWHLLRRDFDLHWLGTNAHFAAGMFGWAYMIGVRVYFSGAGAYGKVASNFALAGCLLMVSIVNRGVASGSGRTGIRYGGSVEALFRKYTITLFRQAFHPKSIGPLEIAAIFITIWGLVAGFDAVRKGLDNPSQVE